MAGSTGEILPGLWRFEVLHPEWTPEDGGAEGWEESVAWWAVAAVPGLVLVDPLVADWPPLDRLVDERGGCAGIIRTCHWHQRSIAEAAVRYRAEVWAKPPPSGTAADRFDHALHDGALVFEAVCVLDVERADEIALWLPAQAALAFGDAMLRTSVGHLRQCPASWLQPEGGSERLQAVLKGLGRFPVAHVLVSHGPLVLGDAPESLTAATR